MSIHDFHILFSIVVLSSSSAVLGLQLKEGPRTNASTMGEAAELDQRCSAYSKSISRNFVALPPQIVEGPTQAAPYGSKASVEWERIQLQVEPGNVGRLILLIAKPAGSTASYSPKPAVLIVHSTGTTKEVVAEHLERYAHKGFVAVAFDARYHGERALANAGLPAPFSLSIKALGPKLTEAVRGASKSRRKAVYNEAIVKAWKTGKERPFIYDTVSDAYRVVDYLTTRKDVNVALIGATGYSLGGMVTWLLAASDKRIAAAAPAIGVQSFRYAVEKNLWGARVRSMSPVFKMAAKDLGKDKVDTETVKSVWKRILPGMIDGDADAEFSLPCIAPRPLLILSAELDPRCCIDGVREAVKHAETEYAAQGAESSINFFVEKGVGHNMTANMWSEIDTFF
mmetsp:Transcript_37392/g.65780  ORF Transcript_37392/g.65780 Transcript_37392/m.65780 type:complete len:398 (-) Transcript_37392:131-1324(-)